MKFNLRPAVVGAGALGGVVSWLLGYVLTYGVVLSQFRDSIPSELLEAVDDASLVSELAGWVYFNAHFVTTVREVPVLGAGVTTYIGNGGFTPVLYLVPVGVLFAGGLGMARLFGAADPADGAVLGTLLTPGYLLASLIARSIVTVEVSTIVGDFSAAPTLVPTIVLAGVLYPALVGAVGGAIGGR